MDAKRKQALLLAMDPELPLKDIAEIVKANAATVRSWVWRARKDAAEAAQEKAPPGETGQG